MEETIWQRSADLSWLYAIFARNADTLLVLVWPNQSQGKPTHTIQEDWEEPVESTTPVEVYDLYHVQGKNRCPYMVQVVVNGAPLQMEVDTEASVSLISVSTYLSLWKVPPKLQPTTIQLRTYSGQQLTILGALEVIVEY